MQTITRRLKKAAFITLPQFILLTLFSLYPQPARAIDFTGLDFVQYGDAQSYSLPIAAFLDGCENPGCEFYVQSSPGQISDLIVVATGASGMPVNTNFAGMDNAYSTPQGTGSDTFFSTGGTTDPGQVSSFTGDQDDTWDATLLSLKNFLGGDSMVFYFNNNQTNSGPDTDQNLAAWALITIRDATTGAVLTTFEFSNMEGAYANTFEGGGGEFNGNVTTYASDGSDPFTDPTGAAFGDLAGSTDYVLSGGPVCLTAANIPVSCSNPLAVEGPFNHNLGADQAAYALIVPELDSLLNILFSGLLSDAQLANFVMNIDLRLGCDPGITDPDACIAKNLNNGYEQMFIAPRSFVFPPPPQVPEPASFILFGFGLLGLAAWKKRRSA